MTADASYLGFAKQTAKGTPNTTDGAFKYLLFNEGAYGPNNIFLPLDKEIGGGALLRSMVKVGVTSGGALTIIPRPSTLGDFLYGALGEVATTGAGPDYVHTFTMPADQFAAPYYTVRYAPGFLWGEQYQDCRFNLLTMSWRGADFVRGAVGNLGGLPAKVSTAAWSPATKVDGGPQFLAPLGLIELPTGTPAKVLAGSFVAGMGIPLDEQFIVGSYVPDDFNIVGRTFILNLTVKITDATLYTKIMYDPAGGNAWAASIFREALITLRFDSDQNADTATPYRFTIAANGQAGTPNVAWSAQPIALRAGRNVLMNMTGAFLADPTGAFEPITIALTNTTVSY